MGRAGRFSKDSMIIYQTINPKNEVLKNIVENKIENFFTNELRIRKQNNLPPYFRLIAIIISSDTRENSYQGALEIKKKIAQLNHCKFLVQSPIYF